MIKFSSSLKLNELHIVDSPFNEDPKIYIFSREALVSCEGRPGNLGKIGNNKDIYCYANRGGQFRKRISAPTPWYQNPCDASIFLHARQNFRKKVKNSIFRPKFDLSLGSSAPEIQGFKNFLYDQSSLVID